MNLQQARDAFEAASKEFEDTTTGFSYPDKSLVDILVSGWTSVTESITGRTAVSNRAAWDGLTAGHNILRKLADASNDADEVDRYGNDMKKLTAEAKRLVAEGWEKSEDSYKPAAVFKAAAASLRAALAKAKAQAQLLNLAADLISAFARVLTVI
jgi:hypothetical protein